MIWVFAAACLVQIGVWKFVLGFGPLPQRLSPPAQAFFEGEGSKSPVSIVVCFHNEVDFLEQCLLGVLDQDHPEFEVVAVDDHSTDGSADIVGRLAGVYPNLRLLQPGPTRPGKKDALSAGIAAARYENLLLTDADCVPASDHWIAEMTAPLAEYEVVLGCSPYKYRPGGLNFWQRFEATYVALQYVGFAGRGMPYMGVGRNLAYRKSFFARAGGLALHSDLPGGDDDLLINGHALAGNTVCVIDPGAWTYSEPTQSWREYLRQKLRHQSVGRRYRGLHKVVLTGLALSHGILFLTGFLLLFTPLWYWAICWYTARFVVVYDTYTRAPAPLFLGADAGAGSFLHALKLVAADMILAPYYLFLAMATAPPARRW